MKQLKRSLLCLLCACMMITVTACGTGNREDKNNDGVLEDVGEGIDNGVRDVADGVDEAVDDVTGENRDDSDTANSRKENAATENTETMPNKQ